jgi:hypothetical protein
VHRTDCVAAAVELVLRKEQMEFASPEMFRLVRCGNRGARRDGSGAEAPQAVHTLLPPRHRPPSQQARVSLHTQHVARVFVCVWLAEPVHAALPRSGVVDVLSRTIGDYGATPPTLACTQRCSGMQRRASDQSAQQSWSGAGCSGAELVDGDILAMQDVCEFKATAMSGTITGR